MAEQTPGFFDLDERLRKLMREHAFALAKSPLLETLLVAPGNPGMAALVRCGEVFKSRLYLKAALRVQRGCAGLLPAPRINGIPHRVTVAPLCNYKIFKRKVPPSLLADAGEPEKLVR